MPAQGVYGLQGQYESGQLILPVSKAGEDQTKFINELITLDGSSSTPGVYDWTQSSGPAITLTNPTSVNPTFTATVKGTYTFSLTVTANNITSLADEVTVTVNDYNTVWIDRPKFTGVNQ